METRAFDVAEASLSVVVSAGGFHCALEARRVARLEPVDHLAGADAERPRVRLAEALALEDPGEGTVAVVLRDRPEVLVADAVEAVRDLGATRFLALPALTKLTRPAFRGVFDLDGDLVPALDVDGLLDDGPPGGGGDGR